MEKDYGRVRKIFGPERVDSLLREVKEREEIEKEKRKLQKRTQRDVR